VDKLIPPRPPNALKLSVAELTGVARDVKDVKLHFSVWVAVLKVAEEGSDLGLDGELFLEFPAKRFSWVLPVLDLPPGELPLVLPPNPLSAAGRSGYAPLG